MDVDMEKLIGMLPEDCQAHRYPVALLQNIYNSAKLTSKLATAHSNDPQQFGAAMEQFFNDLEVLPVPMLVLWELFSYFLF